MCIDNFDTWFSVAKVTMKRKKVEDILQECWNNAFQAGKESRDEETLALKKQIKELEIDSYGLELELKNNLDSKAKDVNAAKADFNEDA